MVADSSVIPNIATSTNAASAVGQRRAKWTYRHACRPVAPSTEAISPRRRSAASRAACRTIIAIPANRAACPSETMGQSLRTADGRETADAAQSIATPISEPGRNIARKIVGYATAATARPTRPIRSASSTPPAMTSPTTPAPTAVRPVQAISSPCTCQKSRYGPASVTCATSSTSGATSEKPTSTSTTAHCHAAPPRAGASSGGREATSRKRFRSATPTSTAATASGAPARAAAPADPVA